MITIKGTKGSGKTSTLIQMSVKNRIPILVANNNRRKSLLQQAKIMGYTTEFKEPIILEDYLQHRGFFKSRIYDRGIYIDDIDDVIQQLFMSVNIHAITYTIDEEEKTPELNGIQKIFKFIKELFI